MLPLSFINNMTYLMKSQISLVCLISNFFKSSTILRINRFFIIGICNSIVSPIVLFGSITIKFDYNSHFRLPESVAAPPPDSTLKVLLFPYLSVIWVSLPYCMFVMVLLYITSLVFWILCVVLCPYLYFRHYTQAYLIVCKRT